MRITRTVAVLISVACVPWVSRAADVQVTSSTQFLWYQDYLSSDKNQYDAAELLRMNVTNIDGQGKVNVYGYGRIDRQLSTSVEPHGNQLFNDYWNGRLYYFYLDYQDAVPGHLDLRAGRTYVPAAALPGTIDGLYFNVKNLGPGLGATAFGGRRVIFDNKGEVGTAQDTLWGASVYLDTVKLTHAELSYARQYSGSSPSGTEVLSYLGQESVALDLSTTPHEMVNILGRAKYDLVSDRFSEVFIVANVTPIKQLVLSGEYYNSTPTFDQFSFYRFFNVNHYQQLSLGVEVRPSTELRVHAKYAHEDFGDSGTAERFDAGVTWRPIANLVLDASFERRFGYAGEISGLRGNASYRIAKATLLAGADYDDFGRDNSGYGLPVAGSSTYQGTAKKYWAGFNYDFNTIFSAVVRAEDNLNFYFSHAYQGFAALNVHI